MHIRRSSKDNKLSTSMLESEWIHVICFFFCNWFHTINLNSTCWYISLAFRYAKDRFILVLFSWARRWLICSIEITNWPDTYSRVSNFHLNRCIYVVCRARDKLFLPKLCQFPLHAFRFSRPRSMRRRQQHTSVPPV